MSCSIYIYNVSKRAKKKQFVLWALYNKYFVDVKDVAAILLCSLIYALSRQLSNKYYILEVWM